jgi:very-short-patch-repair endonuclease
VPEQVRKTSVRPTKSAFAPRGGDSRGIAELFAAQALVARVDQLTALGLSAGAVRTRVAAGTMYRVHRGVYSLIPPAQLSRQGRYLAAAYACGDSAYVGERQAGALHDLVAPAGAIVVYVVGRRAPSLPGISGRRSDTLAPQDVTTIGLVPVTNVARTILDIAARPGDGRRLTERAIENAHYEHTFDLNAMNDVIDRNPNHRGINVVRNVLAALTANSTATANDFEELMLEIVRAAGLPDPTVNHPLTLPNGTPIKVDFCWPEYKLAVETDGERTHNTPIAFQQDRTRDQYLAAAAWRTLRFTWYDLHYRKRHVANTIRALIDQQRQLLGQP